MIQDKQLPKRLLPQSRLNSLRLIAVFINGVNIHNTKLFGPSSYCQSALLLTRRPNLGSPCCFSLSKDRVRITLQSFILLKELNNHQWFNGIPATKLKTEGPTIGHKMPSRTTLLEVFAGSGLFIWRRREPNFSLNSPTLARSLPDCRRLLPHMGPTRIQVCSLLKCKG